MITVKEVNEAVHRKEGDKAVRYDKIITCVTKYERKWIQNVTVLYSDVCMWEQ